MKIGLLGFGSVGEGVYDIVKKRGDMEIAYVLRRQDTAPEDVVLTHDFSVILNDSSVDTIVEVIGGLEPAWDYVKSAMEAGKNVVTANKALVNHYYDEILALIEKYGVKFRCTSAVGGGIGWLTELERCKQVDKISRVGGIMNGTCNYILYNMTTKGLPYDEVLKKAQELGYAEADPTADVEGIDTWNKLIISANVAYDVSLDSSTVPCSGISKISAEDIAEFTNRGYTCKLMGVAEKTANGICAAVNPVIVKNGQPAAAVPQNYNLISMTGENSGPRSLFGQGAGRYPTAYNVVQDLVDVNKGINFYTKGGEKVKADNSAEKVYYVRGVKDEFVNEITSEVWGEGVITKPVAIEKMHAWLKENTTAFIAAME